MGRERGAKGTPSARPEEEEEEEEGKAPGCPEAYGGKRRDKERDSTTCFCRFRVSKNV